MGFGKKAVKSSGSNTNVDWNALNEYVIETANLKKKEVIVGVVSNIIDLGNQNQQDAEYELKPNENKEEILEKFPKTKFIMKKDPKTGIETEYKTYPQQPIPKIAITVDFYEVMLDKGRFFDDDENRKEEFKPLRLVLNNEFILNKNKIVARPLPLRLSDEYGGWGLKSNNTLYKMAVAAELIEDQEVFDADRIPELLGKAFSFEVQISNKKSKKNGKEYYNEYCIYSGKLMRGINPPKVDDSLNYVIMMDEPNDPEGIKQLRQSIINTMMLSPDYEDSSVRKEIEEHVSWAKEKYEKLVKDLQESEEEEASEEEIENLFGEGGSENNDDSGGFDFDGETDADEDDDSSDEGGLGDDQFDDDCPF